MLVQMGTSLLGDFEQQYSVQTAEITSRIGRLATLEKHERLAGIQQVQRLLVDVENLLEQMELTVRELDPSSSERGKYELRVRSYRNDKKQLDSELDKAVERLKENADRDELMAFDNEISLDQVTDYFSEILFIGQMFRRRGNGNHHACAVQHDVICL
ncbi:Vesicle transport through interaction with t-SNAREs -like protein 1A [Toxocara canis]|uniref:Vesicle transport through interaction with t-SNAREs-like protein 1A n=1 Tax=Toxocara canis TaxID=6265 RepID=A0A0B2UK97_TOXCA|nr:Vesicle transport through interaction with t-SNAREs -like protein 1A [Toxocara canis]